MLCPASYRGVHHDDPWGITINAAGPLPEPVRDHLANERTFLAWVRTAPGLIGLGFVLAREGLFLRRAWRRG